MPSSTLTATSFRLLTLPLLILDEKRKLTYIFIFTLLYGASRGFIKALKAFIKLLEALQGNVRKN